MRGSPSLRDRRSSSISRRREPAVARCPPPDHPEVGVSRVAATRPGPGPRPRSSGRRSRRGSQRPRDGGRPGPAPPPARRRWGEVLPVSHRATRDASTPSRSASRRWETSRRRRTRLTRPPTVPGSPSRRAAMSVRRPRLVVTVCCLVHALPRRRVVEPAQRTPPTPDPRRARGAPPGAATCGTWYRRSHRPEDLPRASQLRYLVPQVPPSRRPPAVWRQRTAASVSATRRQP